MKEAHREMSHAKIACQSWFNVAQELSVAKLCCVPFCAIVPRFPVLMYVQIDRSGKVNLVCNMLEGRKE